MLNKNDPQEEKNENKIQEQLSQQDVVSGLSEICEDLPDILEEDGWTQEEMEDLL